MAAVLALAGCIPAGLELQTPLGSVEQAGPVLGGDNATGCMIDGRVRIAQGGALNCGTTEAEDLGDPHAPLASDVAPGPAGATPGQQSPRAPGAVADQAPPEPDPSPESAAGVTPADRPVSHFEDPESVTPPPAPSVTPEPGASVTPAAVPDELEAAVIEAEGGSNLAHCVLGELHIGDGFHIHMSDAERKAELCRRLAIAREDAEITLGPNTWAGLDQARRDTWAEVCWWTGRGGCTLLPGGCRPDDKQGCLDMPDTIRLIQAGNYEGASRELLRNSAGDGPARMMETEGGRKRAEKLARWLATGIRD